jgi:hypothetical protein
MEVEFVGICLSSKVARFSKLVGNRISQKGGALKRHSWSMPFISVINGSFRLRFISFSSLFLDTFVNVGAGK